MRITRALIIAAIVLVAVGCSYKGPAKTAPDTGTTLTNTHWKLVLVDAVAVITPADAREVHLILRPDYRVTGFGGCNTFSGTWEMKEDQLIVGPLMSTMMACPEMETEQALLAALDGAVATEISGEKLTITGSDGTELTFQAMYFQ
jgi:putative lipoprotein